MSVEQANYCDNLKTGNVAVANQGWCAINTIDELENVFADTGVMLVFGQAIDNEMAAFDVVEKILNEINGDK